MFNQGRLLICYSLIFTQISSGLDGIINKAGIANKSFADMINAFSAGSTGRNGIGKISGGTSSLINSFSSVITEKDVECIKSYNAEIKAGVNPQTAYYKTMLGTSNAAKDYVAAGKGAIVSTDELAKSVNTSRLAMIGMQAATIALNMALTMGIAVAIQAVVTGLGHLIHAEKEAAESAKDRAEQSQRNVEQAQEEVDQLDELIDKYIALSKKDEITADDRKTIVEVQDKINSLVGQQGTAIDLVNGKYDEQIQKLDEVRAKQAEIALQTGTAAYHDAKASANAAIGKNSIAMTDGYEYVGRITKAEKQALYGAGFAPAIFGGNGFKTGLRLANYDGFGLLNGFDISNVNGKIDALNAMIDVLQEMEGYASSDFYNGIVKARDEYQAYANSVQETAKILMESALIVAQVDDSLNGIATNSAEGFEEYRQKLIELVKNTPNLSEALGAEDISESDIDQLVTNYMSSLDKFSEGYDLWIQEQRKKVTTGRTGIFNELIKLGEGGKVDLTIRPVISTANLEAAGWAEAAADEAATVFTSTFSNATGNLAANFTPILADENGNYIGTMSPRDFQKYAENVISGVHDDYLSLQIGAVFQGDDAIAQAESAAQRIHELHQEYFKTEIDAMETNSFQQVMNNEDFINSVDNYLEKVKELKEAFDDFQNGDFEHSDFVELIKDFPELANHSDDLDKAILKLLGDMDSNIVNKFASQFGNLDTADDVRALKEFEDVLLSVSDTIRQTDVGIDIDMETEGMEALFTAIKESVSATGLTADSINKLKKRYQELEGYNPAELFEKTANGIHLNTKKLRELEAEYEKQVKAKSNAQLEDFVKQYNDLTDAIANCTDADERAALISERNKLGAQIDQVATLAAQYDGLTSAFNRWIKAQSLGEEGDLYDSLAGSVDSIQELYENGLVGTNKFRTAVQLMTNQDMSTASVDELIAAYERGMPIIQRYFTEGADGCMNFLQDVQQLNSEWAHMNADGSWEINFGMGNDQAIADALGINVESVQAVLRKLSDYGIDINLDSSLTQFGLLEEEAEKAAEKLKELTGVDIKFNVYGDELDAEIEKAQALLDTFKNDDGTVNLSIQGAEEAQQVLIDLITRKQLLNQPTIMSVDTTNATDSIGQALALLQELQVEYNNIEVETAIGADTSEAQRNIQDIAVQLKQFDKETLAKLGLDTVEFQTTIDTILESPIDVPAGLQIDTEVLDNVVETIAGITPEIITTLGLDSTEIDNYDPDKDGTVHYDVEDEAVQEYIKADHDTKGTVHYDVDSTEPDEYNPDKKATVTYGKDSSIPDRYTPLNKYAWVYYYNQYDYSAPPTKYGTVIYTAQYQTSSAPTQSSTYTAGARGARVDGTAFSQGDWGIRGNGTALGGELGTELLVHNGKYYTIGEHGAEFFKYRDGDIIFNAEQTEQLFRYGKISSGKRRGSALVNGTASGRAYSSGGGIIRVSGGGSTGGGGGGSTGGGKSSFTSVDEPFEALVDWIEIAIDRIERGIKKIDTIAQSIFKSWDNRAGAIKDEIRMVNQEIDIQQQAARRYELQANMSGLSYRYRELVRTGAIDIETITDQDLKEKIEEYKEYYEKALDCQQAVMDLKDKEAELYKQSFDNVVTRYDAIISRIDTQQSIIDEYVKQSQKQGLFVSSEYYKKLMSMEQNNLTKLEEELLQLMIEKNIAMSSGYIQAGSQAYEEMEQKILDVKLAIEQSKTAVMDYSNTIRDINWKAFDMMQDRISQITSETEFLLKLMENSKMFVDDNGHISDTGLATLGMHGLNYNVYMEQAERYAKEMKKIDRELVNDPYNQDLLERRQDLLELQRESILAAEEEKESVRDLIAEGIEAELEAIERLIDSYVDALESQKDLYDYQKKVADQTKQIASLQKQLTAYEGDTSEENRARLQTLRVSLAEAEENLQESQYEKYISDQKTLLSELYDEYEIMMNMRLDDMDGLMRDMITVINEHSSEIMETLTDTTSAVGYTISDSIENVFTNSLSSTNKSLQYYGDNLSTTTTKCVQTLDAINQNLTSMISSLDKAAGTQTKTIKGYASGAYRIRSSGAAWTQEGRNLEAIVRPSDGAILTPLAMDDSVLNAKATSNIFDMANNPESFITDKLGLSRPTVRGQDSSSATFNGDLNFTLTLPNVQNYEQFKYEMQHDKSFEQMIRSMTIDRMMGSSRFKKYN